MAKGWIIVFLLLAGCDGITYEHTYRVQLADGSTSFLHASYAMKKGDRFNGSMNGSTWLYEQANGSISGTVLDEIK